MERQFRQVVCDGLLHSSPQNTYICNFQIIHNRDFIYVCTLCVLLIFFHSGLLHLQFLQYIILTHIISHIELSIILRHKIMKTQKRFFMNKVMCGYVVLNLMIFCKENNFSVLLFFEILLYYLIPAVNTFKVPLSSVLCKTF